MTEQTVIIIPTYNESLSILKTITELATVIASTSENIQVLVFDSASTDDTQSIVKNAQAAYPWLHLKTEAKKTGLGSAYLQAMKYAINGLGATVIIEFDADLSHQPCYLLPMLEQLKYCDVVIGSRYVKHGSIPSQWPFYRKFISRMGNLAARTALTFSYKDFTSGFKATRAHLLTNALPEQFISPGYAYKIELLWDLHRLKANIVEMPIAFIDRQEGYSKLPRNSIYDSLVVLIVLRFRAVKLLGKNWRLLPLKGA